MIRYMYVQRYTAPEYSIRSAEHDQEDFFPGKGMEPAVSLREDAATNKKGTGVRWLSAGRRELQDIPVACK